MTKKAMKVKPPDVIVTARPVEPEAVAEPKVALAPTVPLDIIHARNPETAVEVMDLAPIHRAAEAAGLAVTALVVGPGAVTAQCGPNVPTFAGATVAEVVQKINAYQCKRCGTGGGHNPNCPERK